MCSIAHRTLRLVADSDPVGPRQSETVAHAKLEPPAEDLLPYGAAHFPQGRVTGAGIRATSTSTQATLIRQRRICDALDPRSHGGAVSRTLRHDPGRCSFG